MGWCLSVLVVLPHQKASPPLSRHFRFSRDPSAALQRHGAIFARDELWQSLHFDVAAQSLKVDRGEIPLIFMLYTSVYMCILYIIYVPTKKKNMIFMPSICNEYLRIFTCQISNQLFVVFNAELVIPFRSF